MTHPKDDNIEPDMVVALTHEQLSEAVLDFVRKHDLAPLERFASSNLSIDIESMRTKLELWRKR